ncbi:MAG: hypothetical protein WA049_02015 [Ferribacterium limneticum]
MTTPLYPTFRKRIDDAAEQIIQQQIIPWSFLNSGHPFRVRKFDGREIAYEGTGFEGSPRNAFWSRYIDPFLEALTIQEITAAVSLARERSVDARLLLPEVQNLLIAASRKVFSRMAEVDRRLLGKGLPEQVALRSVEQEAQSISEFIEEQVRSELAMWKPNSSLWQRYIRLSFINKLGVLGSIASLIGIPLAFYLASSPSPGQVANGDGNTQIGPVAGSVTINPPLQQRPVDPQVSAQAMRTVAETHRENAKFHMPPPPPPRWQEAETLFQQALFAYRQGNYVAAYQGFDQAQRIYLDLYSEFKAAGH